MRTFGLFWIMSGLWLAAAPAHGDEVAPLVPQITPPKAGELIVMFHDALANGLKSGGLSVTPASAVRAKLKLDVENAGCFKGACLISAAAMVGRARVATARVSTVGKNYVVEVRLYSGTTQLASSTGRCDVCTVAEALKATSKAAAEAAAAAGDAPPPPVEQPVAQPAEQPAEQPASGQGSSKELSDAVTATARPGDTGATSRPRWALFSGIGLAAAGVLGIAVGAPLLAIDGEGTNCDGPPMPDKSNCADLYNTGTGGWFLTGMALTALAGSGVMFYLYFFGSGANQQATSGVESFAVVPTSRGGAVFGATGRF